jgi:hypothetical protein
MDDLLSTVVLISPIPTWITVLYGLFIFKKLQGELRIFCWFLFLSGLVQLLSSVLWYLRANNLPLLHLYVVGGYICLAFFYKEVLKGFINPRIIIWSTTVFVLFSVVNALFIQGIFTFASYSLTVESVLVLILSLSTFIFLLNDIMKEQKTNVVRSIKWINYG